MPSVKVNSREPIEVSLRKFKKRLDKEGIMKKVKADRFHYKPSDKKRLKSKNSLKYKSKK